VDGAVGINTTDTTDTTDNAVVAVSVGGVLAGAWA
jgi:hypothetical protein